MLFAEMQFLRLTFGEFRDVERRRLVALLALHGWHFIEVPEIRLVAARRNAIRST